MRGSILNHDLRFNLNVDRTTSFVYSTFQHAQNHILQPIALSIVIVFILLCSYVFSLPAVYLVVFWLCFFFLCVCA